MEFSDVIKTRTSIRDYSDKEVEDEKIKYVLECARWAPSWVNKQCWRFIVVRDKETIIALSKTSIINRWLKHVPVIIVACGDPESSGTNNDIEYYTVDVAIATENLILAATDVGLGTCWIASFDEKKVKEILGIPNRIKVVTLTPLGYPAEKKGILGSITKFFTRSKKRKSLDEIVRYDKW
jgi:nitroreductase